MDIFGSPSFLITFAAVELVLFLALIRLIDLYEHEPFSTLAVMAAWGAIGATALSAATNPFVKEPMSAQVRTVFGPFIAAPLVEEVAKGVALVAAFALATWAHRRFGTSRLVGLTDGIVYGAAVGLGFAFTEDLHYLVTSGDLEIGFVEFASRQGFLGAGMLQHAIFSATFGACLGFAWTSRKWVVRVGLPVVGLLGAMLLHATNNGLIPLTFFQRYGLARTARISRRGSWSRVDSDLLHIGNMVLDLINVVIVLAFVAAIALWLRRQRRAIKEQLPEEVDTGLIDYRDWELVPQYFQRMKWYWELIRIGELDRVRVTRRLHIELANLALLKWSSRGSPAEEEEIGKTRQRIANLKAAQRVDVYAPGSVG